MSGSPLGENMSPSHVPEDLRKDQLDLIARGIEGSVYRRTLSGTSCGEWEVLGELFAGPLCAVRLEDGKPEVLGIGTVSGC